LRGNEAPWWIEADDLASRFEGGSGGVVIDVPGLDEFNGPFGQIAKALNLPAPGSAPPRSAATGARAAPPSARIAVPATGD
jgi:hypothetical protein